MAKDKKIDYQDLTDAELVAKSREFRHELFNLRLQKATARLEKPHRLRQLRREIARCETRLASVRHEAASKAATDTKA
jgi:large subunit ribosomal protein L29